MVTMLTLTTPDKRKRRRLIRKGIATAVDMLGVAAHLDPALYRARHKLTVERDVPYSATGELEHRVDIYRPRERHGLLPAMMYIHGGGFQLGSKETHGAIAARFAAQGMVVFNVGYRLVPKARYPGIAEDTATALLWVKENAEKYGADPDRIVLAGESAGANLAMALIAAARYPCDEAWTKPVYRAQPTIVAALPACGMHNVREASRWRNSRQYPAWICERAEMVALAYQPDQDAPIGLDSPLPWLADVQDKSPLPATCIIVGDKDPIVEDSRELAQVLADHGGPVTIHEYSGEGHAFHALWWRDAAKRAWETQYAFLREQGLIP